MCACISVNERVSAYIRRSLYNVERIRRRGTNESSSLNNKCVYILTLNHRAYDVIHLCCCSIYSVGILKTLRKIQNVNRVWNIHISYRISYRIVCSLSFSFSYDLSFCSSATSILQLGGRTCDLCIYKFFILFFFSRNVRVFESTLCAFVPFSRFVYYDYMTTTRNVCLSTCYSLLKIEIHWSIFYNKFVISVCISLFISFHWLT